MEPMTLGSPSSNSSPAANSSSFLPSFLMGELERPGTPRNNTLSPNKVTSRNTSYVASPGMNSTQEYARTSLVQKTLFGGYEQSQSPSNATNINSTVTFAGNMPQMQNQSVAGPPTQGLFDSLHNDRNPIDTPTRPFPQSPYQFTTPTTPKNTNTFAMATSKKQQQDTPQPTQYNDSYRNGNEQMNSLLKLTSPMTPTTSNALVEMNATQMQQYVASPLYKDYWITVYGFPPNALSSVFQHFAQCGSILDKVFPPQNGNWVHLKYSSRLECDKALNYNEKILSNNIMIGVTQCKDSTIVDKENMSENRPQRQNVRPLTQISYKGSQSTAIVPADVHIPQKNLGVVKKAMDLFFGW